MKALQQEKKRQQKQHKQQQEEQRQQHERQIAALAADAEAKGGENEQLVAENTRLEAKVDRLQAELRVYKLKSANLIKQLAGQAAKWKRANSARAAAKSRREEALQARADDGGGSKRERADAADDVSSDMSKQRAHHVMREMLGALENASGGEDVAGAQILQAFLNNGHVKELLERLMKADTALPGTMGGLQTDGMMVDRLVEAVNELKNSTSSMVNWHAYR